MNSHPIKATKSNPLILPRGPLRPSVGFVQPAEIVARTESETLGILTEAALMERVRVGDVRAFESIIERSWGGVLMYALQLVGGDADPAEDLAQEAFARLWRSRAEWRGEGSVRVWLLSTVRHVFLSSERKLRKHKEWAGTRDVESVPKSRTPLEETESEELRDAIDQAVRTLSPRRREAFTLVHLQGLSSREAAKVMRVRPQTVANYLQAAMVDLRTRLRPYFRSF
jgi:RNA polymerase sigma-70 factor (ECF subfamily)